MIRLRLVQAGLAAGFVAIAIGGAVQVHDLIVLLASLALAVIGYAASRPVPDALIDRGDAAGASMTALIVMVLLIAMLAIGHPVPAVVASGYCFGNRLKAAAIGASTRS